MPSYQPSRRSAGNISGGCACIGMVVSGSGAVMRCSMASCAGASNRVRHGILGWVIFPHGVPGMKDVLNSGGAVAFTRSSFG